MQTSKTIPGLLLFIDFEKAFDTLEWSFIETTLKYYNFGESLILWIKLFYIDISRIQNNGWSLDFFTLSRGVRQGCPLSPFILCAEILFTLCHLCHLRNLTDLKEIHQLLYNFLWDGRGTIKLKEV